MSNETRTRSEKAQGGLTRHVPVHITPHERVMNVLKKVRETAHAATGVLETKHPEVQCEGNTYLDCFFEALERDDEVAACNNIRRLLDGMYMLHAERATVDVTIAAKDQKISDLEQSLKSLKEGQATVMLLPDLRDGLFNLAKQDVQKHRTCRKEISDLSNNGHRLEQAKQELQALLSDAEAELARLAEESNQALAKKDYISLGSLGTQQAAAAQVVTGHQEALKSFDYREPKVDPALRIAELEIAKSETADSFRTNHRKVMNIHLTMGLLNQEVGADHDEERVVEIEDTLNRCSDEIEGLTDLALDFESEISLDEADLPDPSVQEADKHAYELLSQVPLSILDRKKHGAILGGGRLYRLRDKGLNIPDLVKAGTPERIGLLLSGLDYNPRTYSNLPENLAATIGKFDLHDTEGRLDLEKVQSFVNEETEMVRASGIKTDVLQKSAAPVSPIMPPILPGTSGEEALIHEEILILLAFRAWRGNKPETAKDPAKLFPSTIRHAVDEMGIKLADATCVHLIEGLIRKGYVIPAPKSLEKFYKETAYALTDQGRELADSNRDIIMTPERIEALARVVRFTNEERKHKGD